jgi:hypothetical protein
MLIIDFALLVCKLFQSRYPGAAATLDAANRLPAQLLEQRLGFFQVGGVEAFGEPAVDFGEHSSRFITLALVREHPGEARRGTQLRGSRTLPPGDLDRRTEAPLRFGDVPWVL